VILQVFLNFSFPKPYNMILWIALSLALIYIVAIPYSDGFMDTSMWIAKITAPDTLIDGPDTKHLLKMSQAAIMDGWPSNVPFYTTIVGVAAIICAIIYHWWMGIAMYFILIIGVLIAKRIIRKPASFFIAFLLNRMANRVADYKRDNDTEREEASRETKEELQIVYDLYSNTGIPTPTKAVIKANPYGDLFFLRNQFDG
jgi:hypothetical protein